MKKYLAFLGAIALLGAGCSSSATPSAVTPSVAKPQAAANPEARCDALMTLDEAKLISGAAYTQRDADVLTVGKTVITTCTYYSTVTRSGVKPISLLTRYASSIEEAKTSFEQSKAVSYMDDQPLSGIG